MLAEKGIPYEVVPGVTSPIAVPAYNGIPVTHRDYTSSLHIITGHKKAGQPYDINFRALVETKGTLVFLMGVTALPDICAHLLEAGMEPDMPAAILQKGTTAGQKRIVATVSHASGRGEAPGASRRRPSSWWAASAGWPENFEWYEKLPLEGYKVLVTQAEGADFHHGAEAAGAGGGGAGASGHRHRGHRGERQAAGGLRAAGGVPVDRLYQPHGSPGIL